MGEASKNTNFILYPLRFAFLAHDSLFFPPGQAANTLRGALGVIFRSIACVPQCRDSKTCNMRETCPYARTFEPSARSSSRQTVSPSGLADWPRPFAFRARHLDGLTIHPGGTFHFDLHVFSLDRGVIVHFIRTFAALAREGLGPRRGKAELRRVSIAEQTVFDASTEIIETAMEPLRLDLTPFNLTTPATAPTRIRVEFLSPTELKHDHRVAPRPEFPILFSRIRDRISTLSLLYGGGELDIDYQGTNDRAAKVTMTGCNLRHDHSERRSSRTGRSHPIGGFLGTADYEGDLAEFVPYLQVAKWTGVGRQSVWGKGEIEVGQTATN